MTEDTAAGTVTYHWSQDLPHSTYLIFLAAAPYVVVRDSYKTLPVNYWVYPQDEKKALPTYGKTPKMIAFFNKTFGYDYPWQKYDQISVPSGRRRREHLGDGHDPADHGRRGGRGRTSPPSASSPTSWPTSGGATSSPSGAGPTPG